MPKSEINKKDVFWYRVIARTGAKSRVSAPVETTTRYQKEWGRPLFQIFLSAGADLLSTALISLPLISLPYPLECGARRPLLALLRGVQVAAAGSCCGPPPAAAAGRCCGALAGGPPWWSARAARQQELEAARTRSAHRSIRRDPSTSRLVLALVLPLDSCIACKILLRPLLLVLGCESCSWFLSVQVARSTECPRRAQKLAGSRPWGAVREPAVGCIRMGSWPPPLPSWEIFSFFFLLF